MRDELGPNEAPQLEAEFGRGFGRRNLFSMVRFAEDFPEFEIVQSLIAQLGWTHFLHIIDLLFYHRGLRRLVVIDLKLGKFMPADLGQMEFYLRWLKMHETRLGEEEPIGLILCAGKSDERVEVFELESRGIRIAEYLTELPPRELLQRKLHTAVQLARQRLGEDVEPVEKPTSAKGSSRRKKA